MKNSDFELCTERINTNNNDITQVMSTETSVEFWMRYKESKQSPKMNPFQVIIFKWIYAVYNNSSKRAPVTIDLHWFVFVYDFSYW